jgi:hypothetical protein
MLGFHCFMAMFSTKFAISREEEEVDEGKCLMADEYPQTARDDGQTVWRRPSSGWLFFWANIILLGTSSLLFLGAIILQSENQSLRKRLSIPCKC